MNNLGRILLARRTMLGIVAGGAALLLGGCGENENALRYKMTVEVNTPQGVKSGYVVRELVRRTPSGPFLAVGQDRGSMKLRGEAVAVDLPDGKTLFALLTGADGDLDYPAQILFRIDLWGRPAGSAVELWPKAPDTTGLKNTNPLPMLVTFSDANDPRTVQRVDPTNLAAQFGAKVSLGRITVKITDEPVTVGIEKRLAWLEKYYDKMLDGSRLNRSHDLANNLSQNSFQQGISR